jgi:hypothetical protein
MTTAICPFCGDMAYELDGWQTVCIGCFRRWETEYTEKLREEYNGDYKGGLFNGKKTGKQEESS